MPGMDLNNGTCVQHVRDGGENFWTSNSLKDQRQARVLCASCPVRTECAINAREVKPVFGVWAGVILNEKLLENSRGRHGISPGRACTPVLSGRRDLGELPFRHRACTYDLQELRGGLPGRRK